MDSHYLPPEQGSADTPGVAAAAAGQRLPAVFWRMLEEEPYAHDLFNTLRWIDARGGARDPLGRAASPRAEPVRVRQEPSLSFAPATLAAARAPRDGRPGEVAVFGFGLFGPNGPLPLHMTEHVRERIQHQGDRTLAAFADMFHHRLALLFYRAWADAQGTVSMDRGEDRHTRYVASLLHMGQPSMRKRDAVLDHAKYHMAGHLVRLTRNPEGLVRILRRFFGVQARVEEFVPQWIRIEPAQQLRLGGTAGLGRDTLLGGAVRDGQHKFRIQLGPLSMARYRDFLPGGAGARQLLHWLRQYIGIEFAWDARLVLRAEDAQGVRLGQPAPLGLASWLGTRPAHRGDAADLCVDYESRAREAHPAVS